MRTCSLHRRVLSVLQHVNTSQENATRDVPFWLEEMDPELDAAVAIPTDIGTFGPSLAVEVRLAKLNIHVIAVAGLISARQPDVLIEVETQPACS